MKYYYIIYSILFGYTFLKNSEGKIDLSMFFGVRNSNKSIFIIESCSRLCFVLLIVALVGESIVNGFGFNIFAIIFQVLSLVLFYISKKTMSSSWATNIEKSNSSLVSTGVFAFSRNPVYVAYHLLFISMLFVDFKVFILVYIIFSVVFHLLILQEEKFLKVEFGEEYIDYCSNVRRYI